MRSLPVPCLALWLALLYAGGAAADELACGSLENAYGPYDYTNAEHRTKYMPIVVTAHFTRDVETLRRGATSANVIDDIHYTLRAFPNHHRALDAAARYYLQGGKQTPNVYSAECYFDRAIRFKPTDGQVYLLFATYLHRQKKHEEAEKQYRLALQYLGDSADAHYNLGLLYSDMGRWEEAKARALDAYRLAHPLPGLKRRLQRKGLWTEADDRAIAQTTRSAEASVAD